MEGNNATHWRQVFSKKVCERTWYRCGVLVASAQPAEHLVVIVTVMVIAIGAWMPGPQAESHKHLMKIQMG